MSSKHLDELMSIMHHAYRGNKMDHVAHSWREWTWSV